MKRSLETQITGSFAGILLLIVISGCSGHSSRSQQAYDTLPRMVPISSIQATWEALQPAVAGLKQSQTALERQKQPRQASQRRFVGVLGSSSLLALILGIWRALSRSERNRATAPSSGEAADRADRPWLTAALDPAQPAANRTKAADLPLTNPQTSLERCTSTTPPASGEAPLTSALEQRSLLRILLAEDQPLNQKMALLALQRLGYRADTAGNGLEVLAALRRQPYDVVLMDVQMPEMDGLEATRRICQEWNTQTRPRIIALTANRMPGDRERCLEVGMDDYLSKPICLEALADALSQCHPLESWPLVSAGPVLATDAILDRSALVALQTSLGETTSVGKLIDYYLTQAPRLLATMNVAIAQGNAAKLRLAAHALRSNSAMLGAVSIAIRCEQLEAIAGLNTTTHGSAVLAQLEADYEQVRAALQLEQLRQEA